jgi:hypothetical protein
LGLGWRSGARRRGLERRVSETLALQAPRRKPMTARASRPQIPTPSATPVMIPRATPIGSSWRRRGASGLHPATSWRITPGRTRMNGSGLSETSGVMILDRIQPRCQIRTLTTSLGYAGAAPGVGSLSPEKSPASGQNAPQEAGDTVPAPLGGGRPEALQIGVHQVRPPSGPIRRGASMSSGINHLRTTRRHASRLARNMSTIARFGLGAEEA